MLGNKDVMARNIKRLLEVNDMSVADLSRALDVPYTTASEWVHAKAYPRIDKIERMARLFRVMKSDLVEEEANHKKKARRVPVYGRIAAGLPLEAVQAEEGRKEAQTGSSMMFLTFYAHYPK